MIKTMLIRHGVPRSPQRARKHRVRVRSPRRASIPSWRWIKAFTNRPPNMSIERAEGIPVFVCAHPHTGATLGKTMDCSRAGAICLGRYTLDSYRPAVVRAVLQYRRPKGSALKFPKGRWKYRSR